VAHQGGIVGGGNLPMRPVLIDPNTLANLPRFHTGGDIGGGLQPGEHMIVAQSGEQVRTQAQQAADAKAMANAQASQGKALRQVLVFDKKDISQAMSGSHGEDVTLTHIRNNSSSVREMLK
jgi:hypothetical protein